MNIKYNRDVNVPSEIISHTSMHFNVVIKSAVSNVPYTNERAYANEIWSTLAYDVQKLRNWDITVLHSGVDFERLHYAKWPIQSLYESNRNFGIIEFYKKAPISVLLSDIIGRRRGALRNFKHLPTRELTLNAGAAGYYFYSDVYNYFNIYELKQLTIPPWVVPYPAGTQFAPAIRRMYISSLSLLGRIINIEDLDATSSIGIIRLAVSEIIGKRYKPEESKTFLNSEVYLSDEHNYTRDECINVFSASSVEVLEISSPTGLGYIKYMPKLRALIINNMMADITEFLIHIKDTRIKTLIVGPDVDKSIIGEYAPPTLKRIIRFVRV